MPVFVCVSRSDFNSYSSQPLDGTTALSCKTRRTLIHSHTYIQHSKLKMLMAYVKSAAYLYCFIKYAVDQMDWNLHSVFREANIHGIKMQNVAKVFAYKSVLACLMLLRVGSEWVKMLLRCLEKFFFFFFLTSFYGTTGERVNPPFSNLTE